MRRSNPFVIGSILVALIGAMVFIQAGANAPTAPPVEDEHKEALEKLSGKEKERLVPTVDELRSELGNTILTEQEGSGGMIPPSEKFRPPNPDQDTLPSGRWFEGAETPLPDEELGTNKKSSSG
ncbi:MAG: hypothetical protein AKCLJLPJ_02477 [Fimbriimonadales bacterium]|nr:hypothetical protein [Fimbriimonadales bacterium]